MDIFSHVFDSGARCCVAWQPLKYFVPLFHHLRGIFMNLLLIFISFCGNVSLHILLGAAKSVTNDRIIMPRKYSVGRFMAPDLLIKYVILLPNMCD
jgi:hypothetical protein